MKIAIETTNLRKEYPGVIANNDVNVKINEGTVMCIIGENGAGKSTLMNMLFGMTKPTSGKIKVFEKEVEFLGIRDAMACGIGMVHQHFMLVKELTVLENIILGSEPRDGITLNYKRAFKELSDLCEKYGMNVPLKAKISDLPVGQQQKVEILKALYRNAKILILDEPTAVLTPQETKDLFENIEILSKSGKTIILITHKLDEVMQISKDIIVMRQGEVKANIKTIDTNARELAEVMVGKKLPEMHKRDEVNLGVNLKLENVSYKNSSGFDLKNLNLTINKGEIVGVAGISGNGQSELAHIVSGIKDVTTGKISLENKDITTMNRRQKMLSGVSFISEDRLEESVCKDWGIDQNMVAGYHVLPKYGKGIFLNQKQVLKDTKELVSKFDVRTPGYETPMYKLSGGNQQKIVIARETSNSPKLIIAGEPTRGVDIGAISFIHNKIMDLRNEGKSVLLMSSDLDEIFKLSDRIIVMFEGEIVANLNPQNITREEIGLYMSGSKRGVADEQ